MKRSILGRERFSSNFWILSFDFSCWVTLELFYIFLLLFFNWDLLQAEQPLQGMELLKTNKKMMKSKLES